MYNTIFVLSDGSEIYPGYFTEKEKRSKLREKLINNEVRMSCGCKSNKELQYLISEDLRIYPAHNNYVHDALCSRNKKDNDRKTAYVVDDEDGTVTAYLAFNPKAFELSSEEEVEEKTNVEETEETIEDEGIVVEKETQITQKEADPPKLTLEKLIRCINIDTYTDKVLKEIEINDNFSKHVFHRMKQIRVSRMKKCIGDLTLELDGVRFIYTKYVGNLKEENNGVGKCYFITMGANGKQYKNFIFPDTMEKVLKKFKKTYGIEPDENTMLAGFQYTKKSRGGFTYKVLGRVHLFQTTNKGIYCQSLIEKNKFETLDEIVAENSNIKYWIPADDESIGGIIKVYGKRRKILLLFSKKTDELVKYDESMYVALVVSKDMQLSINRFNSLINEL